MQKSLSQAQVAYKPLWLIVLSAGTNYFNTAGATGLSATHASGRWLVYLSSPSGNNFGGLNSVNSAVWNSTYALNPPGTLPAGNRYAFALAPTVNVTANAQTRVYDGGTLPADFTCDGAGTSPPLAWSGVPAGTVELALLMTTLAKDGLKWNWVLYGLPPTPAALAVGSNGGGTCGLTSDGPNLAYSPPCSQGPGAKTYTFTLYALSARPTLPAQPSQVTGAVLTDAISTITLAKSELSVSYTRP